MKHSGMGARIDALADWLEARIDDVMEAAMPFLRLAVMLLFVVLLAAVPALIGYSVYYVATSPMTNQRPTGAP